MRSRAIYYRGYKEGMNGRERDKGIYDKRQDNRKNGRGEV
jgi:ribosome modulation factor